MPTLEMIQMYIESNIELGMYADIGNQNILAISVMVSVQFEAPL